VVTTAPKCFFKCMSEQFPQIIYNSFLFAAFYLPFLFHSRKKLHLKSFVFGNKKIINNVIADFNLTRF